MEGKETHRQESSFLGVDSALSGGIMRNIPYDNALRCLHYVSLDCIINGDIFADGV